MTTDGGVRATSWPTTPEKSGLPARAAAPTPPRQLVIGLEALRVALADTRFELPLRGADDAVGTASSLASQIEDYLIPRLSRPETPPLLVIGGSTGGGKSTLLNTLVGEPVSPAGVLRPTTRSPVLVCHPDDFGTFLIGGPLPSLPRSADGRRGSIRVLESDAVPRGLALVDAPDVDSVESENRQLAGRLLAAADLWIFVTTAARYADALPWDLLRAAVARGASVAVVLSRVNHLAHATVSTHLRELLRDEGLGAAPLFVIEQSTLDERGLLAEQAVRSLRMWTTRLSETPAQRLRIVRQTLTGALASISDRVDVLADATRAQRETVATLRSSIGSIFSAADAKLRSGIADGVLFRGDVVGRWQEYAGNGGLAAILEARSGKGSGTLTGQSSIRASRVRAGLVGGVVRLFTSVADEAAAELLGGWRKTPPGTAAAEPLGDRASTDAAKNAEEAARAWLDGIDGSAGAGPAGGGGRRAAALPIAIAAALEDGTLPVGREVDIAGGTVTLSAELLAEVFEDDEVRAAAHVARADLLGRLSAALAAEQRRYTARLDQLEPAAGTVDRLRDAVRHIDRHRGEVAALFAEPAPTGPSGPSESSEPPAETTNALASMLATLPEPNLDLRPGASADDGPVDEAPAQKGEAATVESVTTEVPAPEEGR
ncbi:ABC transporter [Cryptosporangium phraense]|uniref:ABC transporter n=1 Tax=Cryptosporangium phraense TaxID=2593070 RepID=A0A545AH15_9ACTN|nr:ABC transporter [Cryptosporangium phraense]TQS39965.1 ABC transporter [Cryptosporangium phraense]